MLYLGGAVGTVLGSRLAERWDRVTVVRRAYLVTAGALAGVVFVPGPAIYLFVALTSAGLASPLIGALADHTSPRTALTPLIVLPAPGLARDPRAART